MLENSVVLYQNTVFDLSILLYRSEIPEYLLRGLSGFYQNLFKRFLDRPFVVVINQTVWKKDKKSILKFVQQICDVNVGYCLFVTSQAKQPKDVVDSA